jgi:tetratricopeptide (TPR) repeat protein
MAEQAFAGARGARVFLSSLPGKARPGRPGHMEEEEDKETYERDQRLRAHLKTCLAPLQIQGLLTVWHDGEVDGGILWEKEISDHLSAAEVILLLLSPQFLVSAFCYAQLQQALDRQAAGVRVIPVYLRPIPGWEDFSFGELTPLPDHGRPISQAPDEAWAWYEVATGLRALLIKQGYRPGGSAVLSAPPVEAAYREMVLRRPPVPPADSLAPRTLLVEALCRRLTREERVTTLMLTGISGAGKTTLAARVYYWAEQQVQAGCGPWTLPPLWLEMSPDASVRDVVVSLGRALGRPLPPAWQELLPRSLAEALFSLLETADRLVVFDQFETWLDAHSGLPCQEYAGVGEWLQLLNAGSEIFSGRVLFTCQSYPQRLFRFVRGCVQECEVAGLTTSEGIAFLRQGGAPTLTQATAAELGALVERCQGHALTLTALRACFVRDAGVRVVDLLHDPQRGDRWVDEMRAHSLEVLYQQLQPEQRALLQAFAIYRDAVPLAAVRALLPARRGAARNQFETLPSVLLDLRLLQALEQGYYRLHPAVASFVRHRSGAQNAAHLKAARYYREQFSAFHLLQGQWKLEACQAVVEAVWHLCQAGHRDEAYQLMQETALFAHLHHRGYNNALLALYLDLLTGEDWRPEPVVAGRVSIELGDIRSAVGQKGEALQEYQRALARFRQVAEPEGTVEALNNLGAMHQALQEYPAAQEMYQEALYICAQAPHALVQQGTTLNNSGRLAYARGERARRSGDAGRARQFFHEARSCYEQARTWYQAAGLVGEETIALHNLGDACRALGESDRARMLYWQALHRFQEQGDRRGEGLSLNNLGLIYHDLAARPETQAYLGEEQRCYEQALRLFCETDDRWQQRIALRNLGRLYPLCPTLAPDERYRSSLACLLLAKKRATEFYQRQEAAVPLWVERTIRLWLSDVGGQSYETFVQEIEQHAEEIVQGILEKGS